MTNTRAPYELNEADLNRVPAGIIHHIAVVVRSSDQSIIQTGGSRTHVITNNRWIIQEKPIGKPSI